MNAVPDPITTQEQASKERETLLDLIARGIYCTTAGAAKGDHGLRAMKRSCWAGRWLMTIWPRTRSGW